MGKEIVIEHVSLDIGKAKILQDISMEMERGMVYGLVGRNGSGKTMLMKCICGFIKPTSGKITVQGKEIGKETDFPDNVGIIIENPAFAPNYSGFKNLKMLAGLKHRINDRKISENIEKVGLDPKSRLHVRKYSLGMRQRLGIAQAIMEDPDILVLDEPMNGLDKDGVEDVRKLLLELKEQGKTIVIASHNAQDIEILCDYVWEMEKGIAKQIR